MALLNDLPTSIIAEIVQQLKPRLYINFMRALPVEICLKILAYLDPISLVSVIRTCRAWFDIALDNRLWLDLYHLEGWKALMPIIQSCELKVNHGLNESIGHLHRIRNSEGHTNKIRAIENEDGPADLDLDVAMSEADNYDGASQSIFGRTPRTSSSHSSNRRGVTPNEAADQSSSSSKGKRIDRGFTRSESRSRRRDLYATPEASLPPILPPKDPRSLRRSTLWMWDGSKSRYRINWKYLYNMRRRLESNWELCKATPFQLPHPNHPEEGHRECIYSLQFDNNYLVSGSRDRTLRIWNMHTRRLLRPPLLGHRGSVLCLQFDADPEEDLLVSGSSDSNIIIWRFSTGEIIQKLKRAHHESVLNVRFDKRVLVSSSKDKSIKIFNRRPLQYGDLGFETTRLGHGQTVNPVAINVRRYGYEPDLGLDLPVKPPWTEIRSLDGHGAAVNAISLRDNTVVSVSGDRHIKVWNWPEEICTQTIPAHDKGIACVEYDGRRIVSGSSDFEVCIFDAVTGLKVAQLRGHSHLVRTVQAGFGDLPYSQYEDQVEARRVDAEYFAAVEAGLIDHEGERTSQRRRRVNAGSSNPADVQAFGAKLPPGGGGGRTYGRIVSGSYDQSVIIWRRDKEGVWKAAHHLRQEEAAVVAQRTEVLLREAEAEDSNEFGSLVARTLSHTSLGHQLPGIDEVATLPIPHVHDSQPHLSSGVYIALMDQVVPAGPEALRQALTNYPGMLSCHSYLQATIERESSAIIKSQLRDVVADALVSIQDAQNRARVPLSSPRHSGSNAATVATSTSLEPPNMPPSQHPDANDGQPHLQTPAPPPENAPARIFKLQFDARKIVCCSQAPVIVGWDFCNADVELEEAARFFATVD